MHQILETARSSGSSSPGGVTKTKLMYGAFLSHAQAKEYLRVLTENGLLDYDQLRQTFKTTEKGLRFLEIYSQMEDTMIRKAEG
jgi:predicted transcriptional regulator